MLIYETRFWFNKIAGSSNAGCKQTEFGDSENWSKSWPSRVMSPTQFPDCTSPFAVPRIMLNPCTGKEWLVTSVMLRPRISRKRHWGQWHQWQKERVARFCVDELLLYRKLHSLLTGAWGKLPRFGLRWKLRDTDNPPKAPTSTSATEKQTKTQLFWPYLDWRGPDFDILISWDFSRMTDMREIIWTQKDDSACYISTHSAWRYKSAPDANFCGRYGQKNNWVRCWR